MGLEVLVFVIGYYRCVSGVNGYVSVVGAQSKSLIDDIGASRLTESVDFTEL